MGRSVRRHHAGADPGHQILLARRAPIARYDFLVIAAVLTQALLLALKLEHWDEALVIFIFHVVGTIMEVFKTAQGSWIYPEENILRIGGVPLFTGFMYACVGSYIARIWRIFDVRFIHYPPIWTTWLLAVAAYVNFFTHHYTIDIRYALFAFSLLIFGRTWFTFTPDLKARRMPLIVGALLVTFFIWVAENVGTFATAWVYPNQREGWAVVSPEKMGSWYLLMLLSFVLVTAVETDAARRAAITKSRERRRNLHDPVKPIAACGKPFLTSRAREGPMFKSFAAAFLIGALAFAAPATAQDADDEVVVVTGTRYTERYEDFAVPHVAIVRRADSAAQNFTLSSDTRDPAARRGELTEALRGLARAAGTGGVTLGIYDDDDEGGRSIVIPFSVEAGLELIRQGSRPDTSQVSILLRTDIRAGDTYADVEQRFEQFEQRAPRQAASNTSSATSISCC